MGFRDETVAMRERINVLERELDGLSELPEKVTQLELERASLAKQLAKYEAASEKKERGAKGKSDRRARQTTTGEPCSLGWGVASIVFGVVPAGISIAALTMGRHPFAIDDDAGITIGVLTYEWWVTLSFLVMGLSAVILGVRELLRSSWAPRALNYWAVASLVFLLIMTLTDTKSTGEPVSWDAFLFFFIYPTAVVIRRLWRALPRRPR